jgi:hypothetical protein
MNFPSFIFHNRLDIPVVIYDTFDDRHGHSAGKTCFGRFARVGRVVAPARQITVQPVRGPHSAYVVCDIKARPLKWFLAGGSGVQTFEVTTEDAKVIAATEAFVTLRTTTPDHAEVVSFQELFKGDAMRPSQVDNFFQNTTDYKRCTWVAYMFVVITRASMSNSDSQPLAKRAYSLQGLLTHLGIAWPSRTPDVIVTGISCTDVNDRTELACNLDPGTVTLADGVSERILKFIPGSPARVTVVFDYRANHRLPVMASPSAEATRNTRHRARQPVSTFRPAFESIGQVFSGTGRMLWRSMIRLTLVLR